MPSGGPSTSLFSTSKRSACDRCRKQKLRCPPRRHEKQDCDRCARAGIPCITGYTKPLGRISLGCTVDTRNDTPTAAFPSGTSSGSSDSMPSASTPATTESLRPWWIHEPRESDELMMNDSLQFWGYDDAYDNDLDNASDLLQNQSHFVTAGQNRPVTPIIGEIELTEPSPSNNGGKGLFAAKYELRLSQFSFDLSRQMHDCIAMFEQQVCISADGTDLENRLQPRETASDDQMYSNSFGNALRSTSEFLDILQSYGGLYCYPQASTSKLSSSPRQLHGNTTETRLPVSVSVTASLLSSYCRIVAIFDVLFHQLYTQLCRDTSPLCCTLSGPQTLPNLHLAGFEVEEGSLQTKILIQAVQHQFELIEKSLGLPPEFRVSDREEVYHMAGVQDDWSKGMLQAMLGGRKSGEGTNIPISDDCSQAVGSLDSLKRSIIKVRQLLAI